ncbi:hypothetical protein J9826_001833, partial [Acinetobacter baumannii]
KVISRSSSDTYGAFPVVVLAINRPNNFLLHFSKNGKDIKTVYHMSKNKKCNKRYILLYFLGVQKGRASYPVVYVLFY